MTLTLGILAAGPESAPVFGQVSDHGAAVSGAIVTISSGGFVRSVTTDAGGRFTLGPVPPGRYDFRTTASGHAVYERSVVVRSGDGRRNWIEVKSLILLDQQSVSVAELAPGLARD